MVCFQCQAKDSVLKVDSSSATIRGQENASLILFYSRSSLVVYQFNDSSCVELCHWNAVQVKAALFFLYKQALTSGCSQFSISHGSPNCFFIVISQITDVNKFVLQVLLQVLLGTSYYKRKTNDCIWRQVNVLARYQMILLSTIKHHNCCGGLAMSADTIRC